MFRKLVLLMIVTFVVSLPTNASAAITDDESLVIYYTFDDFLDTVTDESGNGHDGTVCGDVTAYLDGKRNGAARFEGVGGPTGYSFLDLDGANFPSEQVPTSGITLAAWVKCQYTGGHQAIFNARASDDTWVVHPEIRSNGQFRWLLRASGSETLFEIRTGAVQWDEWLHYAGTYNKASGRAILYINAEVVGEVSVPSPKDIVGDWDQGARVGYNIDDNRPFTGLMDEFYLFKRSLSAIEISELVEIVLPYSTAHHPSPRDGATDVVQTPVLEWLPGQQAISHDVYFGQSYEDVNDGTAFIGNQSETAFSLPSPLQLGATYYWRIDEVNSDDTTTRGQIWQFTVASFVLIDDFESYDYTVPKYVWDTWVDGYEVEGNGAQVGYVSEGSGQGPPWAPPFVETRSPLVHGGSRSMPFFYQNSELEACSEAVAQMDDLGAGRDWTVQDMRVLSLWFRGNPLASGSFVEGPVGTYTMTASGADIGGTYDQFHFAYKELAGGGGIQAEVVSLSGTHAWAKTGVMIRNTLDPDSVYVMVVVTPNNGVVVQHRDSLGGETTMESQQLGITLPQWLKIERTVGGLVRAYYSADGTNWTQSGSSMAIGMNSTAHIGLVLTSHDADLTSTAQFSDVSFPDASVGPAWAHQDVGIVSNEPEQMYVEVSDNSGATGVVNHPDDPNAVLTNTWTEWNIKLDELSKQGVDLNDVKQISIGFGDKSSPQGGGVGRVYFDDIRLYPSRFIPGMEPPMAGDIVYDGTVDFRDIQAMAADWLQRDSGVAAQIPSNPALAWWKLDGNASDSSGSLNGTEKGDPHYRVGVFGQAIELGGTSYIDLGNPTSLDFGTGDWSVCAWVKTSRSGDTYTVFANGGDEDGGIRYTLAVSEEGPEGAVTVTMDDNITKKQATSSKLVNDSDWHHVVGLRAGDTARVYIDGLLAGSVDLPLGYDVSGTSQHNAYIGAITDHRDTTGQTLEKFFVGCVDDVRVYNYALSEAEVAHVADATPGDGQLYVPLKSPANLVPKAGDDGIYNPENVDVVDFKDYGLLAEDWLGYQRWP